MDCATTILACVAFILSLVAITRRQTNVIVSQSADYSDNDYSAGFADDEDDADWWKKGKKQDEEDE